MDLSSPKPNGRNSGLRPFKGLGSWGFPLLYFLRISSPISKPPTANSAIVFGSGTTTRASRPEANRPGEPTVPTKVRAPVVLFTVKNSVCPLTVPAK